MIDVSSIKEPCRRWYPRIYYGQPEKGLAHRALADIHGESIKEQSTTGAPRSFAPPGRLPAADRGAGPRTSAQPIRLPGPKPASIDDAAPARQWWLYGSVGRAPGCDPVAGSSPVGHPIRRAALTCSGAVSACWPFQRRASNRKRRRGSRPTRRSRRVGGVEQQPGRGGDRRDHQVGDRRRGANRGPWTAALMTRPNIRAASVSNGSGGRTRSPPWPARPRGVRAPRRPGVVPADQVRTPAGEFRQGDGADGHLVGEFVGVDAARRITMLVSACRASGQRA